jgi:hypothetical protein
MWNWNIGRGRGIRQENRRENMIKVHYMHVWEVLMELLTLYNVYMLMKNKIK